MNVSKYKVLLAAVDLGSFSAAAEKLGYTQSGLTHMMNSLEDEIGFRVLERGHYGIKLTPKGERIFATIRELVACEDRLSNEIELVRSFGDNVIRIGAYSSIATHWLPEIAERFRKQFGDVTLNIQTGTVAHLYGGLKDGQLDICFGSRIAGYDFKWTPLATDRFYAILPKDYPISSDEFPLPAFNGTKFLMPGLGFDADISAVFSENSIKPFVTPTYVDDPAIISMVEHGHGISMLSELILANRPSGVRIVPIVPHVARALSIAHRADKVLSLAEKKLISIAKEFIKERQEASIC